MEMERDQGRKTQKEEGQPGEEEDGEVGGGGRFGMIQMGWILKDLVWNPLQDQLAAPLSRLLCLTCNSGRCPWV